MQISEMRKYEGKEVLVWKKVPARNGGTGELYISGKGRLRIVDAEKPVKLDFFSIIDGHQSYEYTPGEIKKIEEYGDE